MLEFVILPLDYSYLHVTCAIFSLTSLAKEYSEHHTYELNGKSDIPSCQNVVSGFFYYLAIILLRLPSLMLLLLLFRYICFNIYIYIYIYTYIYTIRLFWQAKLCCLFICFRYWFFMYAALLMLSNGILAFLTLRPSFGKAAWSSYSSILAPTCFISRHKVMAIFVHLKHTNLFSKYVDDV